MSKRRREFLWLMAMSLTGLVMDGRVAPASAGPPIQFRTPSGEADLNEPIDAASNNILDHQFDDKNRPQLLALLAHRNPKVREKAAYDFQFIDGAPEATAPLAKLLVDPNAPVRKEAAAALARRPIRAQAVVPELIAALSDPDDDVRRRVLEAVGAAGSKAEAAVEPLITLLDSKTYCDSSGAAEALGQIGPAAKRAIPKLIKLLPDYIAGVQAAIAMGRLDAEAELLAAATDSNSQLRSRGMLGLREINPTNTRVVAALAHGAADMDQDVQRMAVYGLGRARPSNDAIVAALAEAAKSTDVKNRKEAVEALCQIDPKLDSAVAPLMAALKDADAEIRGAAAHGLAEYKSNPQARLAALLLAATDDANAPRSAALSALDHDSKNNYPLLLAILKQDKPDVSLLCGALAGLREMYHQHTDELKPLLQPMVQSGQTSSDVKVYAAVLLHHVDSDTKGLDEIYLAGLKSTKADVRRESVQMLGEQKCAAAIPGLVTCLADANDEVVAQAIEAVAALKAEAAVAPLCKFVENPKSSGYYPSIRALGQIGKGGAISGPVLLKLVKNDDDRWGRAPVESLGKVVAESHLEVAPLVAELLPMQKDPDDSKRRRLANAIAVLPSKGCEAAIPMLIELLQDKESDVCAAAANALAAHGDISSAAAQPLMRMLEDSKRAEARTSAIAALGSNSAEPAPIVAALIKYVSGEKSVAEAAMEAIGEKGAAGKDAIPAVSGMLTNGEKDVRRRAIATLQQIGATAPEAAKSLLKVVQADPDVDVQVEAAQALLKIAPQDPQLPTAIAGMLGSDSYAVSALLRESKQMLAPILAAGLKHPNAAVRAKALEYLSKMDDKNAAAPAYLLAVKDQDAAVRAQAANALAALGGYDSTIAPVLVESLSSPEAEVRESALRSLRGMGRTAARALSVVVGDPKVAADVKANALQLVVEAGRSSRQGQTAALALRSSSDEKLAAWATLAAASLDESERKGALLVPLLKSKDPQIRAAALGQLAQINGDEPIRSERGVALLISFLSDDDKQVRQAAGAAVARCEFNDAHVAALAAALASQRASAACLHALAFGVATPQSVQSLVEPLTKLLAGEDRETSELAQRALVHIGPPAVKALLKIAADAAAASRVRRSAVHVLSEIKPLPFEALKELAALTATADRSLRIEAAVALAMHDVAHPKVLEALIAGLAAPTDADDDEGLSYQIDAAFEALGQRAAPAVPQLIALLKGKNQATKRMAAQALMKVGPQSDEVLSAILAAAMADKESRASLFQQSLPGGKRVVPHLVKYLESQDPQVVTLVVEGLGQLGASASPALPALKGLLARKDKLAVQAARAIVQIDPKTDGVLPVLLAALDSEDNDQLSEVLVSLALLKQAAAPATGRLAKLLAGPQAVSAAETLAAIGPPAAAAAPALIEQLKAGKEFESMAAALGAIGPAAKEAAPLLLAGLKNEKCAQSASEALAKMGPSGAAAVPLLMEMLHDEAKAEGAAMQLGQFGPRAAPAVDELTALALGDDPSLAWCAAGALGEIGAPAQASVPRLMGALENGPISKIRAASTALCGLKPADAPPRLIALLSSTSDERSNAAAQILRNYGAAASPAVNALIKNLDQPKRRGASAFVLEAIGPPAAPAVAVLGKALSSVPADERTRDFYVLLDALAAIGPDAKSVLPQIEQVLKSEHSSVRMAAARTIWKIDPARAAALKLKKEDAE
ncbi:MAG: HEAT repeat domain-containing protein [Planctomycetia bacterium]|nr:HEAT repeat domain-containing protein [Planctomycetia bacterium]